jgi:hypothetical protein
MTKAALTLCAWCGRPYQERRTGGRTQRFCRPSCRRSFHAAVRAWALDAIAHGTLTLAEVRSGAAATRALLPTAMSQVPVGGRPGGIPRLWRPARIAASAKRNSSACWPEPSRTVGADATPSADVQSAQP